MRGRNKSVKITFMVIWELRNWLVSWWVWNLIRFWGTSTMCYWKTKSHFCEDSANDDDIWKNVLLHFTIILLIKDIIFSYIFRTISKIVFKTYIFLQSKCFGDIENSICRCQQKNIEICLKKMYTIWKLFDKLIQLNIDFFHTFIYFTSLNGCLYSSFSSSNNFSTAQISWMSIDFTLDTSSFILLIWNFRKLSEVNFSDYPLINCAL